MANGTIIEVLMPGVPLSRVRDDLSATAPCLVLHGNPAWWPTAVGMLSSSARWSTAPRSRHTTSS